MKFDVSIIIVSFNGIRYIDNLFASLKKIDNDNISFEIIFVDNDSDDHSVEYLRQMYQHDFSNLKIIKANKNLGFAGGNNLGVKYSQGEYIVFLNNDTKVDKNWLKNLYKCIKETNAGIVNSKLLFFYDFVKVNTWTLDKFKIGKKIMVNDKRIDLDNKFCSNLLYEKDGLICFGNSYFYIPLIDGINKYTFSFNRVMTTKELDKLTINNKEFLFVNNICTIDLDKNFIKKSKVSLIQNAGSGVDNNYNGYDIGFCEIDNGQYENIREISNACGAAMIMKKSDFIKIGGFDEKFFMYYEDTDLSYRVKNRLGKKLIYCPNAIVRHIHTGSSKEWSPFFIYHVTKNRLLFLKKNFRYSIFIMEYLKQVLSIIKSFIFRRENLVILRMKCKSLWKVMDY